MDVGAPRKGKGRVGGQYHLGHWKGKGAGKGRVGMYPLGLKGKGKGKLDTGKGKGKGKLFTKGKITGGKGYPIGKGKDRPKCWNCGNYEHLSKDCKMVNAVTEG